MAFEKDPNEIGVLWQKHGKKGPYMTGTIEGIGPVVVFGISSTNPKAPNWRVLRSVPKDDRPETTSTLTTDDTDFNF